MIKEVTNKVEFGLPDDESLPMLECVCGKEFSSWEWYISMDENWTHKCPNCGAKLYFTQEIRVWQIINDTLI